MHLPVYAPSGPPAATVIVHTEEMDDESVLRSTRFKNLDTNQEMSLAEALVILPQGVAVHEGTESTQERGASIHQCRALTDPSRELTLLVLTRAVLRVRTDRPSPAQYDRDPPCGEETIDCLSSQSGLLTPRIRLRLQASTLFPSRLSSGKALRRTGTTIPQRPVAPPTALALAVSPERCKCGLILSLRAFPPSICNQD